MKMSNDIVREVNKLLKDGFKHITINDNLIRMQREMVNLEKFDSNKDVKIYIERMERFLAKINADVDKLTNIYNSIYAYSLGLDAFDINIYNKLKVTREKGKFVVYYYKRLPKDAKFNYKQTTNFFVTLSYAIQEYIDKKKIYPKPMYKKSKILIETVYDKQSKDKVWDNDHISRFYISEIINAIQFTGLITDDNGFNTSFEIGSKLKTFSDKTKEKYYKSVKKNDCIAYTKITINPQ